MPIKSASCQFKVRVANQKFLNILTMLRYLQMYQYSLMLTLSQCTHASQYSHTPNIPLLSLPMLQYSHLSHTTQYSLKPDFTHANFVGRFLKFSKQTQAKSHFNAMTSPILKNLLTVYRFWPDSCLAFAWKFQRFCVGRQSWRV